MQGRVEVEASLPFHLVLLLTWGPPYRRQFAALFEKEFVQLWFCSKGGNFLFLEEFAPL